MTDRSAYTFTSRLTGLRLLLPEGAVQFEKGRFETDNEHLAAGVERAAQNDPNHVIKKET